MYTVTISRAITPHTKKKTIYVNEIPSSTIIHLKFYIYNFDRNRA